MTKAGDREPGRSPRLPRFDPGNDPKGPRPSRRLEPSDELQLRRRSTKGIGAYA